MPPANDRDCFRATVEHRRPPRVPYYAEFTPDLHRRLVERVGSEDLAEHFGFYQRGFVKAVRPEGLAEPDYAPYYADEDLPEGTRFGDCGVARMPGTFYHFTRLLSPLRNADDFEQIRGYPIEIPDGHWPIEPVAEKVRQIHQQGQVAWGLVGHMYETAWQIRGYEAFLMDTIERPEWAESLLERLCLRNIARAEIFARAGADVLLCGDDVASQNALMFSPDTWRRLIHERWARVWAAAKKIRPDIQIWYHSDGDILEIVGELVEAGVTILNPLQPECLDVAEIHRRWGSKLTFDGLMGTQSTMPFGSPEEVRGRVREIIEAYGTSGGLIVSPTHVLEPEVPIENVEAFAEAMREFGGE